jgi:hypothetical protein
MRGWPSGGGPRCGGCGGCGWNVDGGCGAGIGRLRLINTCCICSGVSDATSAATAGVMAGGRTGFGGGWVWGRSVGFGNVVDCGGGES